MSSKCGRTWPRCNTLLQIDETITIRYIPCLVYACVCVTSRSAMNFSLVKRAVPVLTRWSEEGNVDDGGGTFDGNDIEFSPDLVLLLPSSLSNSKQMCNSVELVNII